MQTLLGSGAERSDELPPDGPPAAQALGSDAKELQA